MKKLSTKIPNNRAFSLVEVLVSITILLLVVVTPMTIITRANNSTTFSNEQLVAFFLAQEGLEIVEKGRNDLYLRYFLSSGGITHPMHRFQNRGTDMNVFAHCIDTGGCGVQIANNGTIGTAILCGPANNNCRLYYQAGNARSKYVHGGASAGAGQSLTPYTRIVRMVPRMNGTKLHEMKVISTVTWRTGSLIAGQQVELVTYLTNIYDTN